MGQQCSSDSVSACRLQNAPFADERNRYLSHCAASGARPAVLKVNRSELRWIACRLGPDADHGVGMAELMPIALERQNLRGAASGVRRVIDIGRPWLRFLGWWREPAILFLYQDHLDRYVAWMRDERGFTPATVEQWSRTTKRFLLWYAGAGRQLGELTAGDIDNYVFGYRYNPFMTSRAGFAFHNEYSWIRQRGTSPVTGTDLSSSSLLLGFDFDF